MTGISPRGGVILFFFSDSYVKGGTTFYQIQTICRYRDLSGLEILLIHPFFWPYLHRCCSSPSREPPRHPAPVLGTCPTQVSLYFRCFGPCFGRSGSTSLTVLGTCDAHAGPFRRVSFEPLIRDGVPLDWDNFFFFRKINKQIPGFQSFLLNNWYHSCGPFSISPRGTGHTPLFLFIFIFMHQPLGVNVEDASSSSDRRAHSSNVIQQVP